ncbi:MAG: HD domain-containing protein [Candidatus Magasanikbacteria bacterium]
MSLELIKKAANYIKVKTYGEPTGHDWYHIERVRNMAKTLQVKEGGDLEKIELLALLHDLGDTRNYEFDNIKGSLMLRGMMDILDIEKKIQDDMIKSIVEIQYCGHDTKAPSTLEAKIVQDADFLDAMGAIGITRIFSTGGHISRILHDPNKKPRPKLSREDYLHRKQEGTSINYFYEKVLNLPKILNTNTAKSIAAERIKFTEIFLNQFNKDWKGKNSI